MSARRNTRSPSLNAPYDPTYVVVNNLHNLPEMPVVLPDGTLVESFVDAAHFTDSTGTTRSETLLITDPRG